MVPTRILREIEKQIYSVVHIRETIRNRVITIRPASAVLIFTYKFIYPRQGGGESTAYPGNTVKHLDEIQVHYRTPCMHTFTPRGNLAFRSNMHKHRGNI